ALADAEEGHVLGQELGDVEGVHILRRAVPPGEGEVLFEQDPDVGGQGVVEPDDELRHHHALWKARSSRSCCSSLCRAVLPVAGLADSCLLTWRRTKSSRSRRWRRPCTKLHGPMFSGSSWSQTTSLADS